MTAVHHAEAARRDARADDPAVDTLRVSEVFGPTIQGEGPAAGRAAMFVRLMGCNLSCSWCDSAWTWDASRHDLRAETRHMTGDAIADEVAGRAGIVVITGGEPLLQQRRAAFARLLERLAPVADIHVETNGTIEPRWDGVLRAVDLFVVSPKLPNAGEHRGAQDPGMARKWVELATSDMADAVAFKLVVETPEEVSRTADRFAALGVPPSRLWFMPQGTTAEELAGKWRPIADAAAALGANVSHRLHVLAWGEERGR